MPKDTSISRIDMMRIAAHIGADLRTVKCAITGTKRPMYTTQYAIRAAARELGISAEGLNHVGGK